MKVFLTIAGSDSGGGAGIQADIKTACHFKVFATTAITAITAQNTLEVKKVYNLPTDIIKQQIQTVFEDIKPDVIKIGMLSSKNIIKAVYDQIKGFEGKIILDPVMISTSKAKLLEEDAIENLKNLLIPAAYLITPNLDEAALLANMEIKNEKDMLIAAEKIAINSNAKNILIKGGHLEKTNTMLDILRLEGGEFIHFSKPKIDTKNTHGTGCCLSSAIACNLALGNNLISSVRISKDYVFEGIENAPKNIGSGFGPINHF